MYKRQVRYVPYTGLDCFDRYNNGFEGVIFLIDEIHIEFNSLESKNNALETVIVLIKTIQSLSLIHI